MSDPTDIRGRITRLTLAADLPREVWSELCKIDSDLRAALRAQAASAERMRAVVREAFAKVSDLSGAEFAQRHIEDIATRVAAQLAPDRPLAQVAELEGRPARLESTHDLTAGMLTGAGQQIAELLATLARMAPVVAAADAWLDDPCKGLGSHSEHDLEAAVRAYRATAPAPDS